MREMKIRMHQLKGAAAAVAYGATLNNRQHSSCSTSSMVSLKEEESTMDTKVTLSSPPIQHNKTSSLSPTTSVATVATTPTATTITTPRIPSSAVACIRDKDGVSFCQRLKEEVCSNAYDQLLTEPLFDAHGFLNETVASHPVPIVTDTKQETRSRSDIFYELEQSLFAELSPSTMSSELSGCGKDLVSCSVVWNQMAKHPLFEKFDLEDLCDELKKRAKCSRTGPVFEEYEVQEVMTMMEERVKREEEEA